MSHVQIFWAVVGVEILVLRGQNSIVGGRSSVVGGLKVWIKVAVWELLLGDFDKDHLLKGRADLVVGGGLCLILRGLEESHLDLIC